MKKRLAQVLLLALLLTLCAPVPEALAAEADAAVPENTPADFTTDSFRWSLQEDGAARIEAYYGKEESLTIPDSLQGHPVASVGEKAFSLCRSLVSVTIPDSVTMLGANPFFACSRLTEIRVSPEHPTLAAIDGVLFSKEDLQLLCYPRGREAEDYVIPEGSRSIGEKAFFGCKSLVSVTIPDSVVSIGDCAFSNCSVLTEVAIPDSVEALGVNPFRGCSGLTGIRVSPEHPALTVIDGVLFSREDLRLVCCPCGLEAENYEIPEGTRIIGDEAFYACESLVSVTIPDSVVSIGEEAFGSTGLTALTIPDSVTSIGSAAFSECDELISITLPEGLTGIGDWTFGECGSLASLTIPEHVTSIGECAFYRCVSLTSLTIPNGVTSIGSAAFSDCGRLASVTLPDRLTSIGDWTFSDCRSLSAVTVPDGVASIGMGAFNACGSLCALTIPDSVTSIGDWAFSACDELASLTLPETVTSIGDEAFSECPGLTVTAASDSFAAQYCKDNGIPYRSPDGGGRLDG